MRHYLFQLDDESAREIIIDGEDGLATNLPFRNHRESAGTGDQIVLWVQGADARAFAIGEITGPESPVLMPTSFREPDGARSLRPAFPVELTDYLERDVHRSELKALDVFAGFPFAQANVHNPFTLTSEQYDAILRAARADDRSAR